MQKCFPFIVFLLFLSCELIVDVDVPFEKKQITVNSFFNPDSLWTIQLNLNRHVLDEQPFEMPDGAHAVIYQDDQPSDTLISIGNGQYQSDNGKPDVDKNYSIRISHPNHGELRAHSSVPSPAQIISAEMYASGSQNTTIKVKLQDAPAEDNFYELFADLEQEYYQNQSQTIIVSEHRLQLTSEDPAIQNDNEPYSNTVIFKDILFNGKEVELTFKVDAYNIANFGVINITLRTLSEDGYNYLRTARLQENTSGDPFAQPVNVYNNIQNGFGIFAGYSTSFYTNAKPRPVITEISPSTGKAGDHIFIIGENFSTSPDDFLRVSFQTVQQQSRVEGQIVSATPTQLEVIVPPQAVTGKVTVFNGRVAVSASDFTIAN